MSLFLRECGTRCELRNLGCANGSAVAAARPHIGSYLSLAQVWTDLDR